MLLRYLKEIELKNATKTKQANGISKNDYVLIKKYNVQIEEMRDEISASIYGANINRMLRVISPNGILERYLKEKINNKEDNVSKYFIFIGNVPYSIKQVQEKSIDIERL